MSHLPGLPPMSASIEIARAADFALGGLTVQPSRRRVSGTGVQETIQPRVMQVLVALHRANEAVVSREELIERCWDGVAVGDDAINRCIVKIRQIAELGHRQHFEIETIPRVGYRLVPSPLESADDPVLKTAQDSPSALAGHPAENSKQFGPRFRYGSALVVICIAILAAALIWRFSVRSSSTPWTVVESHQPFIGTSLIERYPALSPDGTMLAYSAGPSVASAQIFLRILKSDASVQLTHEAYDALSPAWSPDGSSIAYSVFQSGKPCRIMQMQIPSGHPYQIGKCLTAERALLAFDPSGQKLVFNDRSDLAIPERLVELDIANGHISILTTPPKNSLGDESPAFSPDGRFLVYDRMLDGIHSEVRLRQMSDGQERVITTLRPWNCAASPAWTPDGAAILMSGACQAQSSLALYPLNGNQPSRILSGGNSIGRISVSANGYVAMEVAGGHAALLAFKSGSNEPPARLDEQSGLTPWCADFAPDGALAVTGTQGSSFGGVWVADSEGAPFRMLMSLPDAACSIRWSPDGTRFAFIQARGPGFDVPIYLRSGEFVARFHFTDKDSGLLEWATDGKSILTSRFEKSGWRIWRTDLATLKSEPITAFGWWNPRVDGQMLFAEKADAAGVWRIDQDKAQRIADGPSTAWAYLYTISGDRIFYADASNPESPMIASQSIYGGDKTRFAALPLGVAGFTLGVNPKSGDIVSSMRAEDDADIALIRLARR